MLTATSLRRRCAEISVRFLVVLVLHVWLVLIAIPDGFIVVSVVCIIRRRIIILSSTTTTREMIKSEIESFFSSRNEKTFSFFTKTLNTYESLSLSSLDTSKHIRTRSSIKQHTQTIACRLHSPAVVVAVTAGSSAACEV